MSIKLSAVAPAWRRTFGVFPRQNAINPSSLYTVLATFHADPDIFIVDIVVFGVALAIAVIVAVAVAVLLRVVGDDWIDFCSWIKSFIRSIGATAVLANTPAAAPAMASIKDVLTLSLFDSFDDNFDAGAMEWSDILQHRMIYDLSNFLAGCLITCNTAALLLPVIDCSSGEAWCLPGTQLWIFCY